MIRYKLFCILGSILIAISQPGFSQIYELELEKEEEPLFTVPEQPFASHNQTPEIGEEITLDDFKYVPNEKQYQGSQSTFLDKIRTTPGLSFLSSALVPGLGQAAEQNWFRAAAYIAVEATAIGLRISKQSSANRRQQQYNQFVDENWSVVKYARWLVDYKNFHEGANLTYDAVAENPGDLNSGATFNNETDWNRVDLDVLNQMEQNTSICDGQGQCRSSNFSHVVPRFGTQQYYELASKYFQFGPGWNDFNQNQLTNIWSIDQMSANWQQGANMADLFNDNFRTAGNMATLLIVNHVVSAFDAFFTAKLNVKRLHAEASIRNGGEVTLSYNF